MTADTETRGKTATVYRLATPEHLGPYGLKTIDLLKRHGVEVDRRAEPPIQGGLQVQDQTVVSVELEVRPLFSESEGFALRGFLAGDGGLTRQAYALDLRQYVQWCTERRLPLFCARRADIESFGRHLEALGRARATISRRLARWRASTGTRRRRRA